MCGRLRLQQRHTLVVFVFFQLRTHRGTYQQFLRVGTCTNSFPESVHVPVRPRHMYQHFGLLVRTTWPPFLSNVSHNSHFGVSVGTCTNCVLHWQMFRPRGFRVGTYHLVPWPTPWHVIRACGCSLVRDDNTYAQGGGGLRELGALWLPCSVSGLGIRSPWRHQQRAPQLHAERPHVTLSSRQPK